MGFARDLRQNGFMDMLMQYGQQRQAKQEQTELGNSLANIFMPSGGGMTYPYPESPMSNNPATNSAVMASIADINGADEYNNFVMSGDSPMPGMSSPQSTPMMPQINQAAIAGLMRKNPQLGMKAMEMGQAMQTQYREQMEAQRKKQAAEVAKQTRELQNIIHAGLGLEDQADQDKYFIKSIKRLEEEGKPVGRLNSILSEPDVDVRRAQMNEMLNGLMKAEDMANQFVRPNVDEAADNARADRKQLLDEATEEFNQKVKLKELSQNSITNQVEAEKLRARWTEIEQRKKEFEFESGQLSPGVQTILDKAQSAAFDSSANVGKFETLAEEFENNAGELGGGAGAAFSEMLKEFTGQEDAISQLRRSYSGIRASQAVRSLPPGPASDKDIELALSGFPKATANGETISSFLKGLAKMEAYNVKFQEFKSDLISRQGDTRNMIKQWKEHVERNPLNFDTGDDNGPGLYGNAGGSKQATVDDLVNKYLN